MFYSIKQVFKTSCYFHKLKFTALLLTILEQVPRIETFKECVTPGTTHSAQWQRCELNYRRVVFSFPTGKRRFFFPETLRPGLGYHQTSYLVRIWGPISDGKTSEGKYDHYVDIQGDQKVSVHLMITIEKVTSNVQSVPRQSLDIYWHARGTLDSH
jgi:hypothetical protein